MIALVALCQASFGSGSYDSLHRLNKVLRQERPGCRERPFTLLKLRTMSEVQGRQTEASSDAVRLTRLGVILRKLSIDELPQLWNVVKGEMSLVGPRPLLIEYLPYYTERERLRASVRP